MLNVEHSGPAPAPQPARPRRWLRRCVWTLAVLVVLLVAGYVFRVPLLVGAARAWVVNDPVAKADAIVVLGGGLENRPFAAARLFRAGVAPRILYMDVKRGPAEELGIFPSEREITRRILLSNGVPESAIQAIGASLASTFDESRAVRAWAGQSGARSFVIVTDLFHTRRARWIFHRELAGTPVQIHLSAVNALDYQINNWWQHEDGLIQFQNELVKSVYYRLKY